MSMDCGFRCSFYGKYEIVSQNDCTLLLQRCWRPGRGALSGTGPGLCQVSTALWPGATLPGSHLGEEAGPPCDGGGASSSAC